MEISAIALNSSNSNIPTKPDDSVKGIRGRLCLYARPMSVSIKCIFLYPGKRNKLTIRNIEPDITSTPQPMPGTSQENRSKRPSIPFTQQFIQCQKPLPNFLFPAYTKEQQMHNVQTTNAYPQVGRHLAPLQDHNQFQNPDLNCNRGMFDGIPYPGSGNNFAATNYCQSYGAPMPQLQPTSSNWNMANYATKTNNHDWYRHGNAVVGEFIPNAPNMNYNDNSNVVPRLGDKAPTTDISSQSVSQNMSWIDLNLVSEHIKNFDETHFDIPEHSFDENNENTPTR